jgi:hypothetical protein
MGMERPRQLKKQDEEDGFNGTSFLKVLQGQRLVVAKDFGVIRTSGDLSTTREGEAMDEIPQTPCAQSHLDSVHKIWSIGSKGLYALNGLMYSSDGKVPDGSLLLKVTGLHISGHAWKLHHDSVNLR